MSEEIAKMNTKSKWIPRITLIAILVIFGTLMYNMSIQKESALKSQLQTQQTQIADLKSQIATKQSERGQAMTNIVDDALGVNMRRKEKDDAIANTFFTKYLTWKNAEQYDKLREELIADGYLADGSFMSIMFPDPHVIRGKAGKKEHIVTNDNLNIQFVGLDSAIENITPNKFSYLSTIKWSTTSAKGNVGYSTLVCTYDVSSDGKISNIEAYLL